MIQISSEEDQETTMSTTNISSSSSSSTTTNTEKNAAERNFSDIDFRSYLLSTFFLCTIRSVCLHPVFIVVARKQVCPETGTRAFFDITKSMIKEEGGVVKAFSQGIALMSIGSAVSETFHNAVFEYGRYSLMEQQLEQQTSTTTMTPASAGAAAAWGADWSSRIVFSPFNVIAMRQMTFNCPGLKESATSTTTSSTTTAAFQNNKTSHMIRESYRANGVKSFFRGLGFNLFVGSFTSSIFFGVYLKSKEVLYSQCSPKLREIEIEMMTTNNSTPSTSKLPLILPTCFTSSTDNFFLNSSASIFASLASSVLANPYFVLLGKVQVGNAENVRGAFKQVMLKHGVRGFFRGALAGTAATVLENFLASTTYELAMKYGVVAK